jgi:hypothetical protein
MHDLPRLNWILPSLGLLRGVRWFKTDVSGLSIGPILKGKLSKKLDPLRCTRLVLPKRRFQTTLRRVIAKNTEEFGLSFFGANYRLTPCSHGGSPFVLFQELGVLCLIKCVLCLIKHQTLITAPVTHEWSASWPGRFNPTAPVAHWVDPNASPDAAPKTQ